MRRHDSPRPQRAATDAERAERDALPRSAELHLRNYDVRQGYDVEVVAVDDGGATRFDRRYYLQPGAVRTERGALDPGEYEVTVELDNARRKTLACRVGEDPEATVLVECGNGALSLTRGIY